MNVFLFPLLQSGLSGGRESRAQPETSRSNPLARGFALNSGGPRPRVLVSYLRVSPLRV